MEYYTLNSPCPNNNEDNENDIYLVLITSHQNY